MKRFTSMYTLLAVLLVGAGCASDAQAGNRQTKTTPAAAASPVPKAPSSGIDTENFDPSVKPAHDFFAHTNGKWLEKTEIPADRSNFGSFSELADAAELNMKAIIEESAGASDVKSSSTEAGKVGRAFISFMDEARVNALRFKPLEEEFQKLEAIKTHEDVASYFGHLHALGLGTPFQTWIDQDARNATEYALYLGQGGLLLPDRDYYLEKSDDFKKAQEALGAYVESLSKLFGRKDGPAAAKKIMSIEHSMAQVQWSRVDSRDREKTYNKMTSVEAEKLTGKFSLKKYYEGQQEPLPAAVIVRQPSFFKAFGEMFRKLSVKDWKTYARIRLLDAAAPYLHQEIVDARFAFKGTALSGVETNRPRWKRGVAFVESTLGEVVGKLYVERHFPADSKAKMEKLVANLKVAFGKSIDGLSWMSDETKKAAHEKLSKFVTKIGYPNVWKNYADLDVAADDLLGNQMRSARFVHHREMSKLGKPVDREEWFMTPQTVNAYYNSNMNEIVFPAAILQPPFFDPDADPAANYGAIGAVIGHELSHGFDDQGSKSDGDGNLRDWWQAKDKEEFKARSANLIAQYDAYAPFPDAHVNGAFTLGENIGDLGGLTVAYAAYRLSVGDGGNAPVIDNMTGDQRFFYGWGQIWRRKYREPELRKRLKTDPHSPSRYRVLGILSNIPEFYSAFDVKPEDAMYIAPEKRVKIW